MTTTRLTLRISGGTHAISKSHINSWPREGVKVIGIVAPYRTMPIAMYGCNLLSCVKRTYGRL